MSLKDTLRKAASLVVELPPEAPKPFNYQSQGDDSDAQTPQSSAAAAVAAALAAGGDDNTSGSGAVSEAEAPSPALKTASTAPVSPAVVPSASRPKTIEQIVRDSSGPNLDEIAARLPSAAGALGADGNLDFSALYQAANLPQTPFTAEQTVDMIGSLPQSLPLDIKRQTVQVTLDALGKAIGATAETIVADTSRKLAALAAYSDNFAQSTDTLAQEAEAEIADLMARAEAKKGEILAARQTQDTITQQCRREADRLDDVLEFFSKDIFPSRHAEGASVAGE